MKPGTMMVLKSSVKPVTVQLREVEKESDADVGG